MIDSFKGKYYFLSNFYISDIEYEGLLYHSVEAAFQAQKCPNRAKEFCILLPNEAKALGRTVQLRSDWEEVKVKIMMDLLKIKFTSNESLKKRLLDTSGQTLIEGNNWNDKIWGAVKENDDWVGKNILGKLLMTIRDDILKGEY